MHWFDRISKGAGAAPDGHTRRAVLKGAALATVALPFVPNALPAASAATPVRRRDSSEECTACFTRTLNESVKETLACQGRSPGAKRTIWATGATETGKKKKPLTPAQAAKQAACLGKTRKKLVRFTESCRQLACAGFGTGAPPIAKPGPGSSNCPSGTTYCGATLCCYGGDSCCPCSSTPEGLICCAAVIGCTCC